MGELDGQTALITGGATGIGFMMAKKLFDEGAHVIISGRRKERLLDAQKQLTESADTGRVTCLPGDVSTKEGLDQLLADYTSQVGNTLDHLVCNAGILKADPRYRDDLSVDDLVKQLTTTSFEDWQSSYACNTIAPYIMAGLFLPLLHSSRTGGNVIMTSSIAGVHWSAKSSNASYGASKAALNHLVKILANKLSPLYVRVNAIAPGLFPSEIVASGDAGVSEFVKQMESKVPAKRMGNAEEMGKAALFLATCTYMHGHVLVLDGGRSLRAGGE
jgi:NAD(P)-dependent dehydrogenase (short-subunit alcohol dehydrogenase family)